MKKTIGFYLSILSAVLALICVYLYGSVSVANNTVRPLLIASVVISALVLAATVAKVKFPGGNLLPIVNSALCMGAIGLASIPLASSIVFVALGMNDVSSIQGFITFAVVAAVAWICNIVSAFCGIKAD